MARGKRRTALFFVATGIEYGVAKFFAPMFGVPEHAPILGFVLVTNVLVAFAADWIYKNL